MTTRTPPSTRFADTVARYLGRRFDRRGFFARSAVVGSALAVNPVTYALRPTTAYAAICNCNGSNCDCGALCCDGYTEFCCTLTGQNTCPPGTLLGGWWKADGTAFCNGPRYYMDCNAPCNGCGCGANGICSGSCSGTGCGCAQGDCNNRKSGCTMFRYGQCNQHVPCMGPIVCRVVTCVPPWAIEPSCTTTLRIDQATAGHDRPCLHRTVGSLDSAVEVAGGVRVQGWALDFDTQDPVDVHVYVDGRWAGQGLADRSRPDVGAAYPGYGNGHGYDLTVPAAGGGVRNVCVYAINKGAGSENALLGCRQVRLANPFGSLDGVSVGEGTIRLTGWAIDPDTTGPVTVHVYVNDKYVTEAIANRSRPDVGATYPGYGNQHGFDVTFPFGPGRHRVCVYAINVGDGTTNPLIACRTVEIGVPFGSLDSVAPGPGRIAVRGWVIDPDTAAPTRVRVAVDGQLAATLDANLDRPDVGAAYPAYGSQHGFAGTVPATPGSHQVCVSAVNIGPGPDPLIACRTVEVRSGNPFGSLDGAAAGPGVVKVSGWVLDPDSDSPVTVHVYVDGRWGGQTVANRPRPDVAAAYPGYGPARGFELTLPVAAGWREVCVYGINIGAGTTNPLIGCRSVFVGGAPFGSLDGVAAGAGSLRVTGWAIDPDVAGPISVHVYVDGRWAGQGLADRPRPDVGAAHPLYGPNHGFDLSVAAAAGSRQVCVYAINSAGHETNPLLACRRVAVP
ncbi:hypothetical protein [Rhabdothermincola sp.]|uniref:hypothetical protein n=1 Tax=Rhabdothermincola sp. TaxID=2820405 RepID=UPI002FE3F450